MTTTIPNGSPALAELALENTRRHADKADAELAAELDRRAAMLADTSGTAVLAMFRRWGRLPMDKRDLRVCAIVALRFRSAALLSQRDAARLAGVGRSTWKKLEAGEKLTKRIREQIHALMSHYKTTGELPEWSDPTPQPESKTVTPPPPSQPPVVERGWHAASFALGVCSGVAATLVAVAVIL